jgi:predicted DNA-binding transcriptional regulator YafY
MVEAAIRERRPLLFTYEDDALPERIGHPHALFLGPEGDTRVEIFQTSGFTANGTLPGWRTFAIDRIVAAERLESTFEPAAGWDPLSDKYAGGVVAMV